MANTNKKNLIAEQLAALAKEANEGNNKKTVLQKDKMELPHIDIKEDKISVQKEQDKVVQNDFTQEKDNEQTDETSEVSEKVNGLIPMEEEPKNVIVTYHNPMEILIQNYNSILQKISDDEKEIMSGFKKKPPQSEVYCNATIQVRRDLYGIINNYIQDARLGKTKVLNEIFMLGIQEFVKKYSK